MGQREVLTVHALSVLSCYLPTTAESSRWPLYREMILLTMSKMVRCVCLSARAQNFNLAGNNICCVLVRLERIVSAPFLASC